MKTSDVTGEEMSHGYCPVCAARAFDEIRAFLETQEGSGDVLLTLGAGDITRFAHDLVKGGYA